MKTIDPSADSDLPSILSTVADGDTIRLGPGTFAYSPDLPDYTNPDGKAALVVRPGCRDVTLAGSGPETIIQLKTVGNGLCLPNVQDFTLRDLEIRGPGMNIDKVSDAYCALVLAAGLNDGIELYNVTFRYSPDHGFGHLMDGRTDNLVLENCRGYCIGNLAHPTLQGDGAFCATHGDRTYISNCYGELCYRFFEGEYGKASQPGSSWTFRNLTITDCKIKNGVYQGIVLLATDPRCKWEYVRISRNLSFNDPGFSGVNPWRKFHPVTVVQANDLEIHANSFLLKQTDYTGIDVLSGESISIRNNLVQGPSSGHGISCLSPSSIQNNTILNVSGYGINYSGPNSDISRNFIRNTNTPIVGTDDPDLRACHDNDV